MSGLPDYIPIKAPCRLPTAFSGGDDSNVGNSGTYDSGYQSNYSSSQSANYSSDSSSSDSGGDWGGSSDSRLQHR